MFSRGTEVDYWLKMDYKYPYKTSYFYKVCWIQIDKNLNWAKHIELRKICETMGFH